MTLIIAARCKDGAIAIADTRTHIKKHGRSFFDDAFEKIRIVRGHLVCNHGYNRIEDKDWKENRLQLSPNDELPVFASISEEMTRKSDKFAAYLFLRKNTFYEVEIRAGEKPAGTHRKSHDRIKRGSGAKYVDLGALVDLQQKRMKDVKPVLERMFSEAHSLQEQDGGTFFSKSYTIEAIKG